VTSWAEYPKKEWKKALEQLKTISKEDHAKVKAMAGIVKSPRSFIFKTPDDYDLKGRRDLATPSGCMTRQISPSEMVGAIEPRWFIEEVKPRLDPSPIPFQ
jgi:hypothetical protein